MLAELSRMIRILGFTFRAMNMGLQVYSALLGAAAKTSDEYTVRHTMKKGIIVEIFFTITLLMLLSSNVHNLSVVALNHRFAGSRGTSL